MQIQRPAVPLRRSKLHFTNGKLGNGEKTTANYRSSRKLPARHIFHEHTEWELFGVNSETKETSYAWGFAGNDTVREFQEIFYHVALKRKSAHYVYVMVLPSCIITSLCLLGLFSPFSSEGERQEKVTLGLTNLLTMAVMLHLVSDSLPKSADGLPLLGKYILFEFAYSSFSTFVTVVIMIVHQRALSFNWSVPDWLAKVTCVRTEANKVAPSSGNFLNLGRHLSISSDPAAMEQMWGSAIACVEACRSLKNSILEDKQAKERRVGTRFLIKLI